MSARDGQGRAKSAQNGKGCTAGDSAPQAILSRDDYLEGYLRSLITAGELGAAESLAQWLLKLPAILWADVRRVSRRMGGRTVARIAPLAGLWAGSATGSTRAAQEVAQDFMNLAKKISGEQ